MKGKAFLVLLALLFVTSAALCGSRPAEEEEVMAEPELKAINLTWSSISQPDSALAKSMKKFKFEVERLSGGRITAELYNAGQIFTQEGELAAAREGTLDMAYYAAGWVAEFVPYLGQLNAVYTFTGYDHMRNVYTDSEIWGKIVNDVSANVGVYPLSAFYLGTRELNLVEKVGPVRHPDDMKGVKLRTPNSPNWIALGKALGGNPTPMSFGEVYMGLKTGVIEGQDNPIPTDRVQKFYEPTRYIIMTDHVVDTVWPSINLKRWNSFADEDREIIMKAIELARKHNDELQSSREANDRAFLEENGIIFIDDPDKEAFADYAKWSYQNESQDVSKDWDWSFYDKIQALRP
jgi:tripartite ATP-independent transporter DctP family solute receptor